VLYVDSLIDVAIRQVDHDSAQAVATARRATDLADALPNLASDSAAASCNGTAHRQLAAILRVLGRVDEAVAHERVAQARLETARRLEPSSVSFVVELADLAFQRQDFAQAAELFRGIQASGIEGELSSELIASELFSGRPEGAIALRSRLRPDDFDQHLYLGLAYVVLGQLDEGLALLDRLEGIPSGALNYPAGAIAALGRKLGGPMGAEIERLGADLDAAYPLPDSADDAFTRVARTAGARLRAAAHR
jgi:tetratricopeptide (TPR) repeat protein